MTEILVKGSCGLRLIAMQQFDPARLLVPWIELQTRMLNDFCTSQASLLTEVRRRGLLQNSNQRQGIKRRCREPAAMRANVTNLNVSGRLAEAQEFGDL